MASSAIVAGGYAAWVFGTTDTKDSTATISVTDENTAASAGSFVVTGLGASENNYELVLDQVATELNTSAEGAHFINTLNITFDFAESVVSNYTDNNGAYDYKYNFTLNLEVSKTLLDYVSISYGDTTIAASDVEASATTATKAIVSTSDYIYAGTDYVLFDSSAKNLTVTYVNEPTSSTELEAMKTSLSGSEIKFIAKCESVMVSE